MYIAGGDEKWFNGKVIKSIELNKEASEITFRFDNCSKKLGVEGDCCSRSWIEHLTMPDDVDGAKILSVSEAEMPPWDGHKCERKAGSDYENTCDHDSLAVYHTIFHTDKGNIVLEYRNDSNGYYGGNLTDLGEA